MTRWRPCSLVRGDIRSRCIGNGGRLMQYRPLAVRWPLGLLHLETANNNRVAYENMGVKDLWNILSPLCERKPVFELEGKTIAIDLSCWVVDSQTIIDNSAQPKMYLRNLYFRTAFLLMHNISPVFVLEGKAPTLKHNTIAKRNEARTGTQNRNTRRGTRSQLNRILKECREMLELMGLACVQGRGEAEAMCAYLNADGLVDGCISQDSDCFLYGARVVYRNFSASAQGNRGGTGGAVDEYSIEKIERTISLGRNKMIALALLCGCDYDDGLPGVGKEAAMKFFRMVDEQHVIQRIKSWKTDDSLDKREAELLYSNVCSSCGHPGKVQRHARHGCTDCGTLLKCNDSFKEERALILNEVTLRKRALAAAAFPNNELIEEFLVRKDPVPTKLDLQWKQPQIAKFIDFMERNLSWEARYAFEKIFPLATRWQLSHLAERPPDPPLSLTGLFEPESIKKIRNIRCVASYEVVWKTEHEILERLKEYAEAEQAEDVAFELSSIEPQQAVARCYPALVEEFESGRAGKSKKRGKKDRRKKPEEEAAEGEVPNRRGTRKKGRESRNNRKMDQFVVVDRPVSLEESFESLRITPKRSKPGVPGHSSDQPAGNSRLKRGPQLDKVLRLELGSGNAQINSTLERMFEELSPDDFVSEAEEDLNMTEIIESICSGRSFRFGEEPSTSSQQSDQRSTNKNVSPEKQITGTVQDENIDSDQADLDNTSDEFADIIESYVPINHRLEATQKQK